MPYAFVAEVEFADDDQEATRSFLHEGLIPVAKSLPGFQSGVWTRAGQKGIGMIIFDTEDNAKAGQATLVENRPPEAPRLAQSGVYEVMGQA